MRDGLHIAQVTVFGASSSHALTVLSSSPSVISPIDGHFFGREHSRVPVGNDCRFDPGAATNLTVPNPKPRRAPEQWRRESPRRQGRVGTTNLGRAVDKLPQPGSAPTNFRRERSWSASVPQSGRSATSCRCAQSECEHGHRTGTAFNGGSTPSSPANFTPSHVLSRFRGAAQLVLAARCQSRFGDLLFYNTKTNDRFGDGLNLPCRQRPGRPDTSREIQIGLAEECRAGSSDNFQRAWMQALSTFGAPDAGVCTRADFQSSPLDSQFSTPLAQPLL